MAKLYAIPLLLLLSTFSSYSQDYGVIDSLRRIIGAAKHDTSTCIAYVRWGDQLYRSDPDTAVALWQKAQEMAEVNLSNNPSSIPLKKYLNALAEALNNIGYILDNKGEIQEALEYYFQSLEIFEELGKLPDEAVAESGKKGVAACLNNIGAIYEDQGDIEKALEHYFKSLKIREQLGWKLGVAICYNNIGMTYRSQGDLEMALEYVLMSFKIKEEMGDNHGVGVCLQNIGGIYDDQGDAERALEYYFKALTIYEETGDKRRVAGSLSNIGNAYDDQGETEKGLDFLFKSLKIREKIEDKHGIAISLNNIAGILLEHGDVQQAKIRMIRMMEISQELGNPRLISHGARMLNRIAKEEGDYEKALNMYELHIIMRDSINNEKTQKATIRQQTKYEFEKAQLIKEQEEKEVARLAAEVTSRRDNLQYSIILIAILVLFGGVLSLGFVKVSLRMAEGIIFFSFLILFEFLLVLADPYIEQWSSGAPGFKLLFNAGIAALIFPAHAFFEARLKRRLVIAKP